MNSKVKTALLAVLLCANIGVMGFAGASAVWMMKNAQKVQAAAPESSIVKPEESSKDESSRSPMGEIGEDGMEIHAVSEDDVTIGGQYHIRSTVKISDAYKSGDTSALSTEEKETLTMASDLLKSIIKDGMSDYEKEKAVYEWMVKNLEVDSGMMLVISTAAANADTPYGVLKAKKGVCVGFATTFRLLMQMMNIECKVVHDAGLGHSWDIAKIDGHWYHTDIYSDLGEASYRNFNMSDAMCAAGHTWDQEFFPKADSLEYNPVYRSRITVSDVYEMPALIRKAMEKKKTIQCYVLDHASSDTEQTALKNMLYAIEDNSYLFTDIYHEMTVLSEYSLSEDEATGYPMLVISFYDPHSGEEFYSYMDEEDRKQANQALRNAFRDLGYFSIPEMEQPKDSETDDADSDSDDGSDSGTDHDGSDGED